MTSRKFFPGILAMDAACCLLVLACVGAAAECRRRRRQHIWQFSLTEMLACVVLCAAALGWWRWHRERHAGAVCLAERLGKKGAHFEFGYAGPVWLERLLGTQMLEQAKLPVKVSLYRNHISLINELLAQRDTFRHLKNVDVSSDGGQISVQCIELVSRFPRLNAISLTGCRVEEEAIVRIAEVGTLREVSLFMCGGMSEPALEKLRASKHIERLFIVVTPMPASED